MLVPLPLLWGMNCCLTVTKWEGKNWKQNSRAAGSSVPSAKESKNYNIRTQTSDFAAPAKIQTVTQRGEK